MADDVVFKIKTVWESNKTFETATKLVNSTKDKVNALNRSYDVQKRSIGQLQEKITKWKTAQEQSFRSDHIKKYGDLINGAKRKIEELEGTAKSCGEKTKSMFGAVFGANLLTKALGMAKSAVVGFMNESEAAYKRHNVSLTQLEQVMRNTMGAGKWDVEEINDFTKAQEKLGVVSRDVQLAGAKELTTYLKKKDSLKQLIPTMNNMLAFQFGLNTTQEQAQNIAQMMGKVLEGQSGALQRNGYFFTEAQGKILEYGTESERVATLLEVVEQSMQGVNEALAATPEGKAKQVAMEYDEVRVSVGELVTKIKGEATSSLQKMAIALYNNKGLVIATAKVLGTVAVAVLTFKGAVWLATGASTVWKTVVAAKTVVMNWFAASTTGAAKAVHGLNAAMKKNIFGLIMAAAVAAITAIAAFTKKTKSAAADILAQASDASRNYYIEEKRYLDDIFSRMEKTNANSRDRNKLVDELKGHYKGISTELEAQLRSSNNLNAAKETMINLIKNEAVVSGMKQVLEEKGADVFRAEIIAAQKKKELKKTEARHDALYENPWAEGMGVGLIMNPLSQLPESPSEMAYKDSEEYKKLNKAKEEFNATEELLKSKEKELLLTLAGGSAFGGGGGGGNGSGGGSDPVSDAITGGGKSVKNFNIVINDGLVNGVTNNFSSSSDDPASAGDFMFRLSQALQIMLNDVNYAGG